jgi:predicted outer membrane repeat protein
VLAIRGPGDAEVRLDDLVVTGGYVRDGADGAGIFLGTGNDLTLTSSTVRGNHAGYAFFDYTRGGGIFAAADSSLTLVGSVVRGNTATEYGGGIAAEAGAIVAVHDGRLIGNASTYGGGIALLDGSLLEVARSLIQDNAGAGYRSSGGGGIFAADSDVRVTASTLSGNNGFYNGGGGIYARNSFVQLTSSTLANNTTSARIFAADGGAVLAQGGVVDLVGCTVTGNRAEGTYAYQPGIGGIRVSDATLLWVANSIVLGNYGTRAPSTSATVTTSSATAGTRPPATDSSYPTPCSRRSIP